jgi:hypothetical protein
MAALQSFYLKRKAMQRVVNKRDLLKLKLGSAVDGVHSQDCFPLSAAF